MKKDQERKVFYGCNQYPDCDFAVWDKPYTKEEDGEEKPQFCPECGSLLVESKGKIKCSDEDCDYTKKKK